MPATAVSPQAVMQLEERFGNLLLSEPAVQRRFERTARHDGGTREHTPRTRYVPMRRGQVHVFAPHYHRAKRLMDVTLASLLLLLLLPVMLLCALCIVLEDPGSPFHVQFRTGKAGRRFRMYKFRSMVKNAEELKEKYAHLNELTWPDFKITNDPRVTKVGSILRKTSLDELPQLLNVLTADMSLVGPRPTSFAASTYALWHTERLEVVPGITGLWQVSGRSNIDFDERLRLDVEYIENRSILYDIKLLFQTVFAVFSRQGAY